MIPFAQNIFIETGFCLLNVLVQIVTQAKLTVNRYDPLPVNEIDIEIAKKAGKEIGFNFIDCQDHGILVTDIVSAIHLNTKTIEDFQYEHDQLNIQVAGSPTAFDNRLVVGDMITSVNGESVRNTSFVDCVLLIKSSQSRLALKVSRPGTKKQCDSN